MAQINFADNLNELIDVAPEFVEPGTVRDVLEGVFRHNPRLRGQVLDEEHRLRKHLVIFVDGHAIVDRDQLSDYVRPESEVCVMPALADW